MESRRASKLKQEIQKSRMDLGFTVTHARSVDFVYFAIQITHSSQMSLMNFFAFKLLHFQQNLSSSHQSNTHHIGVLRLLNQISSK